MPKEERRRLPCSYACIVPFKAKRPPCELAERNGVMMEMRSGCGGVCTGMLPLGGWRWLEGVASGASAGAGSGLARLLQRAPGAAVSTCLFQQVWKPGRRRGDSRAGRGIALICGKIRPSRVETGTGRPLFKTCLGARRPERPPRKPCHNFVKVRARYIKHLKRTCDTASYHTVRVAARTGRQPVGESVNFL